MFQKILGVIFIIIGPFFVIFTEWFLANFGRIPWAEKHLGTEGGSRLFYKLLGIVFVFFGMLMLFNMFNAIIFWIFGPLLPR